MIIFREHSLIDHHQPRLAHCCKGLLFCQGIRPFPVSQCLPAGRNGAGRNQNHILSPAFQVTDHAHQLFNLCQVQVSRLRMGQCRGPYFNYNPFFCLQSFSVICLHLSISAIIKHFLLNNQMAGSVRPAPRLPADRPWQLM